MSRTVYNFSAGPAMLPEAVLDALQMGIRDVYHGMSILEISHRSSVFETIAEQSEQDIRTLLNIPDEFAVLFMHGGGRGQFSAVPLNLLGEAKSADYIVTGQWSSDAAIEAQKYGAVNVAADGKAQQYRTIPDRTEWHLDHAAAYCHYTDNETIEGVEFQSTPNVGVPLVADMTSNLLTRAIDWQKHGCVYAAAQKNLGIAGITVAIVRRDLLNRAKSYTPTILNYTDMAKSKSLYNTPPVFSWYVSHLMLKWALQQGGISVLSKRCQARSEKVYRFLDGSELYHNRVDATCRSRLNITFQIKESSLEQKLIGEAEAHNLWFIKGHSRVGGFRVSLYLGMPDAGVDALLDFLRQFERNA